MKYKIFFDESKKIDSRFKYSYYGAISIKEEKLNEVEQKMKDILNELNSQSELHFLAIKREIYKDIIGFWNVFCRMMI